MFSDEELEFIEDLVSQFYETADGYDYTLSKGILDKINEHFYGEK